MNESAASEPERARGEVHARDFLAPALFSMIAEVRRNEARVAATAAKATNDPEAIHDFRVALRRLRSALRPARRVLGKRRLREIAAELKRFAQATGALRDEEVLRETLGALELSARVQHDLAGWLVQRARQERARRRGVVAMLAAGDSARGPSLGTALAHLERTIGRPRRAEIPASELAHVAIERAFADVEARSTADARDAAAMHELRISWKRVRYTTELFAPILGEQAAAIAKASARMQKRLGELHDVDEALVRIGRARGLAASSVADVRRALHRARRAAAERARGALAEEMSRIRGVLPRRP